MKKNIVKISIFVVIILLAILFMVLGANQEGRKYSIEEVKDYNYFVLQKDGKYGVIDKTAQIIVEPKFENVVIPNPSKAIFICTEENKDTKVYNEKNEEKFSEYEEVTSIRLKNVVSDLMYEKSVLKYKKAEKYGLIDFNGSKITEPIYNSIEALEYKEGELLVSQNGKYGVINIKGHNLVPIKYETVKVDEYYNEEDYSRAGYIVGVKTEEGYRYGYIDVDGNEILKTEFNEISRIVDIKEDKGLYLIGSKNGQYGVYKEGNQIINNEYQSISYDKTSNLFILEKSKKFGVANINGNTIIDVKYSQIDAGGKYLYVTDRSGKTEVYDNEGKLTNMSENISKLSVADGKYTIVINNADNKTLYGIETADEKQIVEPKYNYIEYLFDKYFLVSDSDGKLGVVDDSGAEKVELKYSSIQRIKETKLIQCSISSQNLVEIYTSNADKIVEMNNAKISYVKDYIKVYNEKESIYLTEEGKKVDSKEAYKGNELFAIEKDGKWGFADINGNIKVECKYDKVTEFNQYGFAGIKQDGKWGVMDSSMKVILEPKYEMASYTEPDFLGGFYKVTYGLGEVLYTNN